MRRIPYLKSTSPLSSALLGNPKDLPLGLIRICKGEPSHHVEETHFGPLYLQPQFFQSWPKAHDHNVRVVWTLLTTTERQFSNSISATTSPLCFVSHLWLNLCCLQMTSSFWAQKLSPWSSAGKVWRLSTLGWEGRGSSISGSCWWVRTGWNDFYRLFIFWLVLPILSTTLSLSLSMCHCNSISPQPVREDGWPPESISAWGILPLMKWNSCNFAPCDSELY